MTLFKNYMSSLKFEALLEPSTDLLTFCQFHGNIFLPKFQLQDSRRHSPEGLCQISCDYLHGREFESPNMRF